RGEQERRDAASAGCADACPPATPTDAGPTDAGAAACPDGGRRDAVAGTEPCSAPTVLRTHRDGRCPPTAWPSRVDRGAAAARIPACARRRWPRPLRRATRRA